MNYILEINMRTRNNLFDGMEKESDGKLYAVNIQLKSGEVIHLEHLEKGEKDAYVNYVRTGKDKMLIETSKQVWRILPDDIERLDVKAYNTSQANGVYPFMRFLMVRSRMETETFTKFIWYFVWLLIGSVVIKLGEAAIVENTSILNDFSIIGDYLSEARPLFVKFSWVLIAIMFVLNLLDLILKPTEKFYILDEERSVLEDTKLLHILITLGCMVGFMLVNSFVFPIIESIF